MKWNEITILEEFIIQTPQIPINISRHEVSEIEEEHDGRVIIRFYSSRQPHNVPPRIYIHEIPDWSSFLETSTKNINPNIKVDFRSPIPNYHVVDDTSQIGSSIKSQMEGFINMI